MKKKHPPKPPKQSRILLEQRKQLRKAAREAKNEPIHGPFDTADEMIVHLKAELKKRSKVTKAISESTKDFKTGRYQGPEE